MQFSFRLAELLGHVPDPRKRPGTIKSIVEYTGLDRHQVASLLKNEVKYIPLKALSRLCDYLIEHGYVAADALPGALFGIEAENFWELLARRRRIEMCVGVRQDVGSHEPDVAYVVASDSVLLGELLNGITTLGGTAKIKKTDKQNDSPIPQPEHLKQTLVWSPGQKSDEEVQEYAKQAYKEFDESSGDKALICLGSTKSNPVFEIVMAEAFNAEPFISQDDVKKASDRTCPFFLRYRENDPHPPSCMGGTKLSADSKGDKPGIYYETADGKWEFVEPDGNTQVAIVFYIHRESQGRLEMALGGFSGRATRYLSQALTTRAEQFWPAVYKGQGLDIGAFIVQFELSTDSSTRDALRTDVATTKVIPIDSDVIERRIGAKNV